MYGSTMAPPRLQPIACAVEEYYTYADHTDAWFQHHLPRIQAELFPDISLTSPGADKVTFAYILELRFLYVYIHIVYLVCYTQCTV